MSSRLVRLASSRVVARMLLVAVAVCGVGLRFAGIGRSMWLDEAWVANSVNAASLSGMFYYEPWLQTSPPLFLLLVRGAVAGFGVNEPALRLVPLAVGLLAGVLLFFLMRRILPWRLAYLAWAMVFLSPLAVEYSRTLKQYGFELAATSAILLTGIRYMERPTSLRLWTLALTLLAGLLAGFSTVFVVPGVVLSVCLAGRRRPPFRERADGYGSEHLVRGLVLGALAAATSIVLYLVFVAPNQSPDLRSFWFDDRASSGGARTAMDDANDLLAQLPILSHSRERPTLALAGIAPIVLAGLWRALARFRRGRSGPLQIQLMAGAPLLLALTAAAAGWYPLGGRLSLFLLPGLVLLLFWGLHVTATLLVRRRGRRHLGLLLRIAVTVAIAMVLVTSLRQPLSFSILPQEDMASAMSFLRANVGRGDLIWVHASSSEVFKLYASMTGWDAAGFARFGNTGWPCCPRHARSKRGGSTEMAVRTDLEAGIPPAHSGTIWFLYTGRPGHWRFAGLNESQVMHAVARERGCVEEPAPTFHNVGIGVFRCGGNQTP